MNKLGKILLAIGLVILIGAVVLALNAPRIFVMTFPIRDTTYFTEQYEVGGTVTNDLPLEDWAIRFGGTTGLSTLKRLEKDVTITPQGQALAAEIRIHIQSGEHLDYVEEMYGRISSPSLIRLYLNNMKKIDERWISKHGSNENFSE